MHLTRTVRVAGRRASHGHTNREQAVIVTVTGTDFKFVLSVLGPRPGRCSLSPSLPRAWPPDVITAQVQVASPVSCRDGTSGSTTLRPPPGPHLA